MVGASASRIDFELRGLRKPRWPRWPPGHTCAVMAILATLLVLSSRVSHFAFFGVMDLPQLFSALVDQSLRVSLRSDGKIEVVGDCSRLTSEMKHSLRDHKQVFIDLLTPSAKSTNRPNRSKSVDSKSTTKKRSSRSTPNGQTHTGPTPKTCRNDQVWIGSRPYRFGIWDPKERLLSPIAIDTETEMIAGIKIPRLALAQVSDGKKHRLIHPDDLQAFIDAHASCHLIAHNAAFDFAVIKQAIDNPCGWIEVADSGRLHDTMFLEALIRLGRDDSEPANRNLGVLAKNYLGLFVDKDDPYRKRYSEIIGKPWDKCEAGFFSYAIKDAIVTHKLWFTLKAIAVKLIAPFNDQFIPGYRDRFGLLTESLQVRSAIALDQIHRNGIAIDQEQVESTKQKLSAEVTRLIEAIDKLPQADGIFKRSKKTGEMILTASGKPSENRSKRIEVLEAIADDLDLTPPRTEKTDKIQTAVKYWNQYADRSEFLSLWGKLEETAKLCQFFAGVADDRIYPRYTVLVRTGRTSCQKPNIQQLPRSGGFREMIVPSADHYFIVIDYAAIELRTLAAVCLRRFGSSKLADVISEGIDPHAFTAAMFEGVSTEDFAQLPNKKELRQRAKALNFGIPGGLGAKSLVEYAATTYGVTLSIEDAQAFREKLIEEVYPELADYLKDDAIGSLAHNLKTSGFRVRSAFDTDGVLGAAKRIVAGKGKAQGSYSESFEDRIWNSLAALNQNRKLGQRIRDREAGDQLARDLFFGPVATPTGRLRGRVGFSQARNTPFQGLAADGAKLALWRLYREGFRCVAFVHDEVIVEIPIEADHTAQAEAIDSILCESMATLTGEIPIACEYALADRWYKGAEAVFAGGKLKLWERPTVTSTHDLDRAQM